MSNPFDGMVPLDPRALIQDLLESEGEKASPPHKDSPFKHCRILVVGDVMLDEITQVTKKGEGHYNVDTLDVRLGGAANVAANCLSMSAKVCLVSLTGYTGHEVMKGLWKEHGGKRDGFLINIQSDRRSSIKTRQYENKRLMTKLDFDPTTPVIPEAEMMMIDQCRKHLTSADCVVISDYGKGVVTPKLARAVIDEAKAMDVPVIVDPREGEPFDKYQGATLVKPSRNFLPDPGNWNPAWSPWVLWTAAEKGMRLDHQGRVHCYLPPRITGPDIVDPIGAGDTVIAWMAMGIATKGSMEEIVHGANAAAALVCQQIGTATLSYDRMVEAIAELKACKASASGSASPAP